MLKLLSLVKSQFLNRSLWIFSFLFTSFLFTSFLTPQNIPPIPIPKKNSSPIQPQSKQSQSYQKFYAIAYFPYIFQFPLFSRNIHPKYLKLFSKYYLVQYSQNSLQKFEIYQQQSLYSRTSLFQNYSLHQRFNTQKKLLSHQKLYYDQKGLLVRQENFQNQKLFSFYIYQYDLNQNQISKNIFTPIGDFISQIHFKYSQLKSLFLKNQHAIKTNPSQFPWPIHPQNQIPFALSQGESFQAFAHQNSSQKSWSHFQILRFHVLKNPTQSSRRILLLLKYLSSQPISNPILIVRFYDHTHRFQSKKIAPYQKTFPDNLFLFQLNPLKFPFSQVRLYLQYQNPKKIKKLEYIASYSQL